MKNLKLLGAGLLCASLAACGSSPNAASGSDRGRREFSAWRRRSDGRALRSRGHNPSGGPNSVSVQYSDLARDTDGSILNMSQYDADAYCKSRNSRLPTARELAHISMRMGSSRIRETVYPDVSSKDMAVSVEIEQMRKEGFSVFYRPNAAGQPAVDFYFQASGYHVPAGNLGLNYFWSSSLEPSSRRGNVKPQNAAAFNGETGSLNYYNRSSYMFLPLGA